MIFRERVGGGGKSYSSLVVCGEIADDLRRDLTVSLACSGNWLLAAWSPAVMAGGSSSNVICNFSRSLVPSLPFISVEEAGVGGNVGRGMAPFGRFDQVGNGVEGCLIRSEMAKRC